MMNDCRYRASLVMAAGSATESYVANAVAKGIAYPSMGSRFRSDKNPRSDCKAVLQDGARGQALAGAGSSYGAKTTVGLRVLGSVETTVGTDSRPALIALCIASQNASSIFSWVARIRTSSTITSSCIGAIRPRLEPNSQDAGQT